MRYGSVCSGIEAATVAWDPLGWEAAFYSEIEPFPRAVLTHHYPDTPLHGDLTTIGADEYEPIDLLVGGTPCQSFSIAGLGGGLDDDRGNLALEFLRLAKRTRPQWLLWENVPGVLSNNEGRDFGSILGGFRELGYGFAYRVLDAQFFGVPQRRRRVFVVGYLGDWRRAAAVLFERHSLSGNPPPCREKGKDIAPTVTGGPPFSRTGNDRVESEAMVAIGIDEECNASIDQFGPLLRGGQGGTRQAVMYGGADTWPADVAPTLNAAFGDKQGLEDQHALNGAGLFVPATTPTLTSEGDAHSGFRDENGLVAFAQNQRDEVRTMEVVGDLAAEPGAKQQTYIQDDMVVRRLTLRECERLQGFLDDYTQIEWRGKKAENCPDGPRYKVLGNSMAVPVMRWIGERIEAVDSLVMDNPYRPI